MGLLVLPEGWKQSLTELLVSHELSGSTDSGLACWRTQTLASLHDKRSWFLNG